MQEMMKQACGDVLVSRDQSPKGQVRSMRVYSDQVAEANRVGAVKMGVYGPTSPGVWRHRGKMVWELYPTDVAEIIYVAFCGGERSVEWGDHSSSDRKRKRDANIPMHSIYISPVTHRVDFESMKEVELSAAVEIDIMIVEAAIYEINYTPTQDPIESAVWWKDDSGMWRCYAKRAVHAIRNAWRRKDHLVILKKEFTQKYPQGVKYVIDLTEMIQINPKTGTRRQIKIVSNAAMPVDFWTCNSGTNLTVFSLATELVRGCLRKLIGLDFIQSMVTKMVLQPYNVKAIELNQYLNNGGSAGSTYQKFRHAFEAMIKRVPGCCGQLMRLHSMDANELGSRATHVYALPGEAAPVLKYVFYIAPPDDIESILKEGLDGGRRRMENFAVTTDHHKIHAESCETKTYSLLMLLVVDPQVPAAPGSRLLTAIAESCADHLLPIAVLKLSSLPQPALDVPAHDSMDLNLESGAMNSTPIPCANLKGSLKPSCTCSTTPRLDTNETTTTTTAENVAGNIAENVAVSKMLLPSKSENSMLLMFKLYSPEKEVMRFVGALTVQASGRPSEILPWLRELAGFPPDSVILLYKELSASSINSTATYEECQLEDGNAIAYNYDLTGDERKHYRCPDVPSFVEYHRNKLILHLRKLSNPTEDDFSLELSNRGTYSDVAERVAQHLGLDDDNRVRLTFNDCFFQQPKGTPLDRSCFSTTLAYVYRQTASILYYEVLDSPPAELEGMKTLTITVFDAKGRQLSVHEIELPKKGLMKDVMEELKRRVKGPGYSHEVEMRVFEAYGNKVTRIHPPNEKIAHVGMEEWSSMKLDLRAEEIPEEDKNPGPQDRLFQVRRYYCRDDASRKCEFLGEPFLMVARRQEKLAHLIERIKHKVTNSERNFPIEQCKFTLLSAGRREYLRDEDLVAIRMQKFSSDSYDPIHFFLGIEEPVGSIIPVSQPPQSRLLSPKPGLAKQLTASPVVPKSPSAVNGRSNEIYYERKPKDGSSFKTSMVSRFAIKFDEVVLAKAKAKAAHQKEVRQLVATPSGPPNGTNENTIFGRHLKSELMSPTTLALWKPPAPNPASDTVTHIAVPDPEFHNFDTLRNERDIVSGQVWAIYDNHDGMPRFYGLISQVSRCPFKVQLSWLEPSEKRRWWVESTGLSITCGEYEVNTVFEMEKNIGVFSHKVLDKAPSKGWVQIYPRQGEVWAVYSNWDVLHMIGPEPIITPNGMFKQCYAYYFYEMLENFSEEGGVLAVRLTRTKGFRTIFHPLQCPEAQVTFNVNDLRKFSHSVPSEKVNRQSLAIPEEAVELDPASLPMEMVIGNIVPDD